MLQSHTQKLKWKSFTFIHTTNRLHSKCFKILNIKISKILFKNTWDHYNINRSEIFLLQNLKAEGDKTKEAYLITCVFTISIGKRYHWGGKDTPEKIHKSNNVAMKCVTLRDKRRISKTNKDLLQINNINENNLNRNKQKIEIDNLENIKSHLVKNIWLSTALTV